jgi:hypothetical protein
MVKQSSVVVMTLVLNFGSERRKFENDRFLAHTRDINLIAAESPVLVNFSQQLKIAPSVVFGMDPETLLRSYPEVSGMVRRWRPPKVMSGGSEDSG